MKKISDILAALVVATAMIAIPQASAETNTNYYAKDDVLTSTLYFVEGMEDATRKGRIDSDWKQATYNITPQYNDNLGFSGYDIRTGLISWGSDAGGSDSKLGTTKCSDPTMEGGCKIMGYTPRKAGTEKIPYCALAKDDSEYCATITIKVVSLKPVVATPLTNGVKFTNPNSVPIGVQLRTDANSGYVQDGSDTIRYIPPRSSKVFKVTDKVSYEKPSRPTWYPRGTVWYMSYPPIHANKNLWDFDKSRPTGYNVGFGDYVSPIFKTALLPQKGAVLRPKAKAKRSGAKVRVVVNNRRSNCSVTIRITYTKASGGRRTLVRTVAKKKRSTVAIKRKSVKKGSKVVVKASTIKGKYKTLAKKRV